MFQAELVRTSKKKTSQEKKERRGEKKAGRGSPEDFYQSLFSLLSPQSSPMFSCHPVAFGSFRLNEGLGKKSL